MKKRVLSLALVLLLALTLLPTAALATEDIKTVAVTVTGMDWGKPRPGIGAFSVADGNLQISNINWTTNDDGNVGLYNRVVITVDIKKGVDAKFVKETSIKASVNGESNGIVKKRKSDTQMTITYTIQVANPNAAAEAAAAAAAANEAIGSTDVPQSYDTFDYRAYANVYPDVKAAYGYDAQKLWAHYVNYGKAEGRVATYIEASKNPKTNAPIYGVIPGTTPDTSANNRGVVVPATLLDPMPPRVASETAVWVQDSCTVNTLMSNAKLVAEYYASLEYWKMWETISAWHVEPPEMRWLLLKDEIGWRAGSYQVIYDYEHSSTHSSAETSSYNFAKKNAEAHNVYDSDPTILLHFNRRSTNPFPTPPADPGTVSGAAVAAATAPEPPKPTTAGGFSDVPAGSYYAQPVVWAVEKGVTGGLSAGVFGPNENCTQGQIITFLWRASGQPAPKGTVNMEGFDSSKYYYKAVQWAAEQGILEGAFDPDAPCTRATAMMYLWINGGRKTSASENYKDVPRDSPYKQAIDWAAAVKITGGTGDGNFSPDQVCTRAQIVTFLYRAFNR